MLLLFHLDEVTSGHCGVGWQSLLDVSEDEDAVLVGGRCVKLMTLQATAGRKYFGLSGSSRGVGGGDVVFFFWACPKKHVCVCVCAWNS